MGNAEDRVLVCSDCQEEFVFNAKEQEFFKEKGFEREPKRCKPCRQKRKSRGGMRPMGRSRELHQAVCAECGNETEVPFKPREGRPVYCRECYQSKKR